MQPHPIWSCPYCTSTPIYVPDGVPHHPNIPSLCYLNQTPPIRLTSYISPNLLYPDVTPHYSKMMSKHSRKRRNQRSNSTKKKRRYTRRSRQGLAAFESHYGNKTLTQAEGGGVIETNNPPIIDMSEN